jgi:hypothetical protein
MAVLIGVSDAFAQSRNTARSKFRLVRAQCTTGPCYPTLSFRRGQGKFVTPKEPKFVTSRFIGKITISGLTTVTIGQLEVELEGRRIYGADPDSDCALANTETTGVFGSSTMTCRSNLFANESGCRGKLFVDSLQPPECSDVSVHYEDVRVNVYQGGFAGVQSRLIATDGILTLGRFPDCNSGGNGCP